MKVRILIMPKEGLLDPQGRAVTELLTSKGYKIESAKVGKVIEMEVDDSVDIEEIAKKYLVNPLIESYKVEKE